MDFILDCTNTSLSPHSPEAAEGGVSFHFLLSFFSYFFVNEGQVGQTLSTQMAVTLLAAHGVWVTSTNVFLTPSDCQVLQWKSASVSFLFDQVHTSSGDIFGKNFHFFFLLKTWVLSGTQQGRLLHIIADVLDKLSKEKIKPKVDEFCVNLISLTQHSRSKKSTNLTKSTKLSPPTTKTQLGELSSKCKKIFTVKKTHLNSKN